jgi:hypothetical protein
MDQQGWMDGLTELDTKPIWHSLNLPLDSLSLPLDSLSVPFNTSRTCYIQLTIDPATGRRKTDNIVQYKVQCFLSLVSADMTRLHNVARNTDGQRTAHNVAIFTLWQYTRLYGGKQLH